MTHDPDSDRHALIQALIAAARVERAKAVRRMLRGLLRRSGSKPAWWPRIKPALAHDL